MNDIKIISSLGVYEYLCTVAVSSDHVGDGNTNHPH